MKEHTIDYKYIFMVLTSIVLIIRMDQSGNPLNFTAGQAMVNSIAGFLGGFVGCYILPGVIWGVISIFKKISFDWAHIVAFVISLMSLSGVMYVNNLKNY